MRSTAKADSDVPGFADKDILLAEFLTFHLAEKDYGIEIRTSPKSPSTPTCRTSCLG